MHGYTCACVPAFVYNVTCKNEPSSSVVKILYKATAGMMLNSSKTIDQPNTSVHIGYR